MGELKNKAIGGFGWNIGEKIFSALFSAWVVVNVTNRVFPEDYALKAILAALVLIFNSFVDSGFSQALIRNREATAKDYSSAFWFNVAIAAVVYFALVGLAYPAAALLKMPRLVEFAPVFFLVVPLAAMGIIQQTVLVREFDFRRLSTITFAATVVSGVLAVLLAWAGAGFWAIVAQRVAQSAVRSGLLWIFGRWKPSAKFSAAAIRRMFGYSARLLAADLLTNTYNAVPQMVIGRIHGATLGNFDQARSIRDLPVNSTVSSMQSVTFPALAAVADDEAKYKKALGFAFSSIAFLMFPMMAGLMAVSTELFGVFLAPQWQASVPFFRILCIAGFATPLGSVATNILRTRTDGRAVLRVEIARKIVATLVLALAIPLGVRAITWGVVAIAFTDFLVGFAIARRHSTYGFAALARDVLPTLFLAAAMGSAVFLATPFLPDPLWLALACKIALGGAIYLIGAWLLCLPALNEAVGIVRKVFS